VVFLRHRYYRIIKWTTESLKDWHHNLTHNILGQPGRFQTGDSCRYCQLASTCAARSAVIAGTVSAMLSPDPSDPHYARIQSAIAILKNVTSINKTQAVVGEAVSDLLFRMKVVEQAVDQAKAVLRGALESVGSIPLGDGTSLTLNETTTRTLDPSSAMKLLRTKFSDTELCAAMKLSLPQLLEHYGNRHPKSERHTLREALVDELQQAGAIKTGTIKRMVVTTDHEGERNEHDATDPR
jgi:hypothetical protein